MNDASQGSQTNSSDYFPDDDSQFLAALAVAVLPGDESYQATERNPEPDVRNSSQSRSSSKRRRSPSPPPPPSNLSRPTATLSAPMNRPDDNDDTYHASTFGGWGDYMRRKRAKLQIQNAKIPETDTLPGSQSRIFEGLAIYINGWTRPSVQELRELIVKHGGIFQPYLVKKTTVTHIITCSLTPAKVREFKNMKVVRPEWLTDSATQGILLDWEDYRYVHDQPSQTQPPDIPPPGSTLPDSLPTQIKPNLTSTFPPNPPSNPPSIVDPLYVTDPATKRDAARVPGYAADASNPAARRVMANPEWRKAHTSASSDFIDGYYKNSRLHHLSTWKLELKELVKQAQEHAEVAQSDGHVGKVESELQDGGGVGEGSSGVSMRASGLGLRSPSSKWKGKSKAVDAEERVIMHCDFDCFFVSAGLVSRPQLKGKPVVVCHSQGAQGGASSTSEIASSSYEARKFGIKNGMSLQQARQLCPEVMTIPYEFERYKEFSLLFYTVLMQHADDLQAVSVDEALIDVSTTVNQMKQQHPFADDSYDPAKVYAEKIRAEIRKLTSCEVSIGISHNILLARLATRRAKPGGSYHLLPAELAQFLDPLEISDLHGFGYHTKQKTQEKLGATNLGELRKKGKGVLIEALGRSTGETLFNALRGIDDRPLESDKPRKSVSCDITYGIRFENNAEAEAFVLQMATEVKKRLDAIGMVGRSITVKIMKRDPSAPVEPAKFLGHGPCDLFNKQMPLQAPGGRATADEHVIGDHAWRLVKSFHFDPKELRGIGIQIQKLEPANTAGKPPHGQSVLGFKPTTRPSTSTRPQAGTSASALSRQPSNPPPQTGGSLSTDRVAPRTDVSATAAAQPAGHVDAAFDLPSFSQVDKSIFEALPDDVRKELETEYKRRSDLAKGGVDPLLARAPSPIRAASRQPSNPPAVPTNRFGRRSATPSIFPPKPQEKPNYGAIASRLAPGRRGNGRLGPTTNAKAGFDGHAMHAWALRKSEQNKKEPPRVKISNMALRDLNLDPDVFFALPIDVQREQLIMARVIKQKGSLPEPPKERKILKRTKLELPPDYVVYRAPKPKARFPTPPALRRPAPKDKGKAKADPVFKPPASLLPQPVEQCVGGGKRYGVVEEKGKLCFRDTEDIESILEMWIETYRHWAPREKDVEYLARYLVQAIDGHSFTDVSVERAIAVMKWWQILARRYWPAYEVMDDIDDYDMLPRDPVGEAWWAAFWDVKKRMDVVARARFGGKLSLR